MKSLALARHGQYLYFVITDDRGKRIYRSTKRSTKSEALRFLLDFNQQLTGRHAHLMLSDFLARYRQYSKPHHAPGDDLGSHHLLARNLRWFLFTAGPKEYQKKKRVVSGPHRLPAFPVPVRVGFSQNSSTTTEQGGSFTRMASPSFLKPLNGAGCTLFGSSNVL